MNKPTPMVGYRMLEEGKDITSMYDLIWAIDEKRSKNGYYHQRWTHSVRNTEEGIKIASDTNQRYFEPKTVEDYCFFRCRKL